MNARIIVIVAALVCLSACNATRHQGDAIERLLGQKQTPPLRMEDRITTLQMAAAKEKIDLSDGVSQIEAYKIASAYLRISEGYVDVPVEEEKEWRVAIYVGVAPLHSLDVFVDKKTGVCRVVDFLKTKEPNKSPEPTPTAVTPRATEGKSK